jgi:hypothetical protein
MYRGFQEPRNLCFTGGVEPLDTTALLAPIAGVGEDLTTPWEAASGVGPSTATASAVAFSSTAASTASLSMGALSATTASSVAFFTVASAASFFAAALEAVAASSVAPDVLGAATVDESGSGVETAVGACCPVDGGPPTGCPSPWSNLLLL